MMIMNGDRELILDNSNHLKPFMRFDEQEEAKILLIRKVCVTRFDQLICKRAREGELIKK